MTPERVARWIRGARVPWVLGLALYALAGARRAAAQTDSLADTARPRYLLPDLRPDALVFEGKSWVFKPIIGILTDYSWFDQDQASRAQVGDQADQADLRAARFGLGARLKARPRVEFLAVLDYVESKRRDDLAYEVLDLMLSMPLGNAKITIGKQKQPFVYEMVALAALLPQQERILSPFFLSRDVGVRVSGRLPGDRVTYWLGWFNDWFLTDRSLAEGGNDYVMRFTAQPLASADGRAYLHVGLGGRYQEAEDGVLRFRGRPESNVADYYVDSGDLPASHAVEVALEALGTWRRWSLLGEWVRASVHGGVGQPRFSGAYATFAWVVARDHRPYDRALGGGRNPVPHGRLGALELIARYAHVDISNAGVDGGVLGKWYLGVNWWASRQWKMGAGYGIADLARGGTDGRTGIAIARLQWLY